MDDLTGKTILHYNILKQVGQGGMGIVYLAEDTQLERKVAIKFLPSHIAHNSQERKRFEIEAKAAAALNHSNIATIHAIERTEKEIFLVMEYITGKNLREHLKEKMLTWPESVNLAIQIAKALSTAHKNNIIHRDIKSANIMSNEDDVVKIMDFGLAKFRGSAQITQLGTTIGTAAYMSPEQARGEEADQRSDIWSFGVVLYEMLTGQLPFKGDYEQAVLYSMLNEKAEPVDKINPDIPKELAAIVNKCMEKDITKRYQNVSDILNDLEDLKREDTGKTRANIALKKSNKKKIWVLTITLIVIAAVLLTAFIIDFGPDQDVSGKTELQKLAILPFGNLKPNPETDYLGFALADQIIGAMSYVSEVVVRPSSTIRKFTNQAIDIAAVGSELDVLYILTGNYLQQGDVIRLNVELVNSKSNELLWRDVIEEQYENTFRLQDIVAEKIIRGLKVQFSPKEKALIGADVPSDPLAYEYYLKAVSYNDNSEGNQLAVKLLNESLALDSSYAPVWHELGWRNHKLAAYSFAGEAKLQTAINQYKKAIQLNPDYIRAITALAVLYTEIDKIDEALAMGHKILSVNPNNADAHFLLSYIYRYAGMVDEAQSAAEMAVQINPDPAYRSGGHAFSEVGENDKALEFYKLDMGSPFYYGNAGYAYFRKGDTTRAIEYINKAIELDPNTSNEYFAQAFKSYISGNHKKALQYLELIEDEDLKDGEMWYALAFDYARYGATKKSINALNKAVDLGFYSYPAFVVEKDFDPLRENKEFQMVMEKAKEKHLAFKHKYFPEKQ